MGGVPIIPPPGRRCIIVDDLRLAFFIGVYEHERGARQEVSISLRMVVADDPAAARSDDLADHVSYADVVARLKERAQSMRHVQLVETLAEEAAEFALADARVESVVVDVRKTQIIAQARGVGVVIHRFRTATPGQG
jgi:FolB domain-containing protein